MSFIISIDIPNCISNADWALQRYARYKLLSILIPSIIAITSGSTNSISKLDCAPPIISGLIACISAPLNTPGISSPAINSISATTGASEIASPSSSLLISNAIISLLISSSTTIFACPSIIALLFLSCAYTDIAPKLKDPANVNANIFFDNFIVILPIIVNRYIFSLKYLYFIQITIFLYFSISQSASLPGAIALIT